MVQIEDYAVFLFQQSRSAASALHEFRLLYTPGSDAHVFLEGDEDTHYFVPEVRRLRPDLRVHHYVCGGKWKVIDVMGAIAEDGYDDAICLFFVDRDYDDLFGEQVKPSPKLYVSDGYAIENDVATSQTLDFLLTDFAKISVADPLHGEVILSFEQGLPQFDAMLLPFLGWALALRFSKTKANFNNVDLRDLFEFDDAGVVRKKVGACAAFAKACFPKDASVSQSAVKEWIRRLQAEPLDRRMRGKFKLWYFEKITIVTLARHIGKVKGDRRRIPACLKDHHVFEALGGRFQYPPRLVQFLATALT